MAKGEVVPRIGSYVQPKERIAIALEKLVDAKTPNVAEEVLKAVKDAK